MHNFCYKIIIIPKLKTKLSDWLRRQCLMSKSLGSISGACDCLSPESLSTTKEAGAASPALDFDSSHSQPL